MPGAAIVAPRGDVSEHGALRFFRRLRRGALRHGGPRAARPRRWRTSSRRTSRRGRPTEVIGLGYSNGANILASVIFARPALFGRAVLMHPLIPWTPEPAPVTTRVLITAGERDPICPPEATRALEAWFRAQGAPVETHWHPGGHEIDRERDRGGRAFPALGPSKRKEPAWPSTPPTSSSRRARARAATSTAPASDEAEMTFSKAGARPRHHRPHRGARARSAARASARRWWRAASPTRGPRARRSCRSARSPRRSSAGTRSGPTCLQEEEPGMSWNPTLDPSCPTGDAVDAIETLIMPRARDLGGFEVRRALPAPKRQMVGPFIFFDQAGPAEFVTGQGVDVRPHPHIGLATVTYLFRGEFQHRDSLGTDQMIHPGAVNWMIAGKGVTHSERTSAATRQHPHSLFGIQTWVALPEAGRGRRGGLRAPGQGGAAGHRGGGGEGAADPRHRLGRAGAGQGVQRDVLRRRRAGAGREGAAAGRARGPRALHRLGQRRGRRAGASRRRG